MNYDEWTSEQQTREVTFDGHEVEMAYYEAGGVSAGEEGATGSAGEAGPVVLLHGIPTSSFLWRGVVDALAEERRVIAPDMVGYGNSSKEDRFDRSIRAQEEALASLLDGLEVDAFSFVGHDLGGGVALRYATHRPDAVEKLVLSNAVAYDSWPVEPIVNLGLPSSVEENSVEDLQGLLDGMFRQTLAADAPDEEFVEAMKAPWNSEEGQVSLVRNAAATNTNHTTEIDLSAVTADTLLLWGADDEFQPIEYAERLRDDVESAELVGIDDANHWVMEDQTERYRDELASFLLD